MSDTVILDGELSLSNVLDGQGGTYSRYDWRGYSAYEVAVQEGFVGTKAEWLASLHGATGPKGDQGVQGQTGPQGEQGIQGPKGDNGDDYVLTEQDKQDIAELVDTPVNDVRINGSSILNNGVANIPMANDSNLGAVTVNGSYGIGRFTSNGSLYINYATASYVKSGTNNYRPIVPLAQDAAAFYGLAKAAGDTTQSQSSNTVGTYTEEAKRAIRQMLGLPRYTEVEIIADVTTEADLDELVINTDQAGESFKLRFAKIYIDYPASSTGAASYTTAKISCHSMDTNANIDYVLPTLSVSTSGVKALHFFKTTGGLVEQYSYYDNVTIAKTLTAIRSFNRMDFIDYVYAVKLLKYNTTSSVIPAGTHIVIQGIRA